MQDKYSAVWVSHSSMGDFLKCPRLYFLHNVYKDPQTGHKISIVTPHMSLGIAVHEVLEGLGDHPAEERMSRDLSVLFEKEWQLVSGKKGGFVSDEEEQLFKARGIAMLETVKANPRFLPNKRLKLPRETMNPNFFLNDTDNIILNGLIDWIEYLPETDSLHIVDFKTGKHEEKEASLQLPIYLLLCNALQKRKVTKASYWYLESDKFVEKELPDAETAYRDVLEVARKVKDARDKKIFECPNGPAGCVGCQPYELILSKDPRAEFVGVGGFNQDMYVIAK
jgi:ATP-dependent helicase/DNAse subunit B